MALEFDTGLIDVAQKYIECLKIPLTKITLKKNLEENPFYPSLYSLKETFDLFKINNEGLRVDKEQLNEIPLPFLAFLEDKQKKWKDFVLVTDVSIEKVVYFYGKNKLVSKEEFLNNWQNIIFIAEPTDKSGENDFVLNNRKERRNALRRSLIKVSLAVILLFLFIEKVYSSNIPIGTFIYGAITLMGLVTASLLIVYEIDKSNAFIKNICTGGSKTNCDAVLNSSVSKFIGLTWSEIGLFYFCFSFLFLLTPIPYLEKIPLISYISVLASFYIPFSLYIQYFKIKQWCPLCLFVQVLLLSNLILTIIAGDFNFTFSFDLAKYFLLCSLVPVLTWFLLKPLLINSKGAKIYFPAYKRLFLKPSVFNALAAERPSIPEGWESLGIQKGNSTASITILKVCSPSCTHCSNALKLTDEIVQKKPYVRVITVFMVTNHKTDTNNIPVKHFLALSELGKTSELDEALHYWYFSESPNYEELERKFPVPKDIYLKQSSKIDDMDKWIKSAGIFYTPALFLNGRLLPETFSIKDLHKVI